VNLSENLVELGPDFTLKYSGTPANWSDFTKDDHQGEDINDILDFTSADNSTSTEEKKKHTMSKKPLTPKEDLNETMKRQVGDWGVWIYYGKSIGILPVFLLLLYCSITTFSNQFPRTFIPNGAVLYRFSLN
jgi:hypothetical protein